MQIKKILWASDGSNEPLEALKRVDIGDSVWRKDNRAERDREP